jgi:hypothetical protein
MSRFFVPLLMVVFVLPAFRSGYAQVNEEVFCVTKTTKRVSYRGGSHGSCLSNETELTIDANTGRSGSSSTQVP